MVSLPFSSHPTRKTSFTKALPADGRIPAPGSSPSPFLIISWSRFTGFWAAAVFPSCQFSVQYFFIHFLSLPGHLLFPGRSVCVRQLVLFSCTFLSLGGDFFIPFFLIQFLHSFCHFCSLVVASFTFCKDLHVTHTLLPCPLPAFLPSPMPTTPPAFLPPQYEPPSFCPTFLIYHILGSSTFHMHIH